jgi:energy-coupling factor transport system permease protein
MRKAFRKPIGDSMIREITFGQYYQTDSALHRLDPRVKLVGTMIYIISLFLYKEAAPFALALVFLAAMIKLSHVPFRYMIRGLKAVIVLLLITAVFNMFLTRGEALVSFWGLTITKEGVITAVFIALRLVFLIIGSSVMTLTTTPNQLTDGLEKLLGPLKVIKVPIHEISMMMSIALRFIPILLEETDKIMKAQMARGAEFESGNLMQKAKSMIPLLVPLFVSAFRRATDLAMAMEARCYRGGAGRTKMKPLCYKGRDRAAYLVFVLYLAAVIAIRVLL